MKQERIKSILLTYLKEKQHSSSYNDVSGYLPEPPEYIPGAPSFIGQSEKPFHSAGKPFHGAENVVDDTDAWIFQSAGPKQDDDLIFLQDQAADLSGNEQYVPLEPQEDELAVGIGRRLSQMSDEFDLNHINPADNMASSNGNRCIQFRERIIRVSATCDRVPIPVVRTGAADSIVNAEWTTRDKSAKAGVHYVNSQGSISFAEGEEEKTIEVEIIRDQEGRTDMHFVVELFDADGIFNTLTVYIVDDSRLCPEEKEFIKNIFGSARNISISEIVTCLRGRVTPNTFKAALQCLCSSADSIPKEFVLASELLRLTIPHAPLSSLTNVVCNYFSYLPELEDIAHLF